MEGDRLSFLVFIGTGKKRREASMETVSYTAISIGAVFSMAEKSRSLPMSRLKKRETTGVKKNHLTQPV